MCLNKMTSSRNTDPQHQKYSSIFHCTHEGLFIPVFTTVFLDDLGSFFLKPSLTTCADFLLFSAILQLWSLESL